MILKETIGTYSQTIASTIEGTLVIVKRDGKTLFSDLVKKVESFGSTIKIKDLNDKDHEFQKYTTYSVI